MGTLGSRIKEAREAKGLLQSQLAEMIGVKSGGIISNWEKDINKPDAEKIVKLCAALDITVSFLLDYYGEEDLNLTLKEFELVKKYRSLNDSRKKHVEIFVEWECENND